MFRMRRGEQTDVGPLPVTVQLYSLPVYISHTAWALICVQTNIQLPKCTNKSFHKGHLSYSIFMVSKTVRTPVKKSAF